MGCLGGEAYLGTFDHQHIDMQDHVFFVRFNINKACILSRLLRDECEIDDCLFGVRFYSLYKKPKRSSEKKERSFWGCKE